MGKYATRVPLHPDEAGRFRLTIPLGEFKPNRPHFPESSVGHEVDWLWVQTIREDAGVIVEGVSIHR